YDLAGGAGSDTFAFLGTARLTGTIDGGADDDTLDASAYSLTVTLTLTARGAVDGFAGTLQQALSTLHIVTGGFANIDAVNAPALGGTNYNNIYTLDDDSTWTLQPGASVYKNTDFSNTLDFSGFT